MKPEKDRGLFEEATQEPTSSARSRRNEAGSPKASQNIPGAKKALSLVLSLGLTKKEQL